MKNAILYNCYGLQARKSLGELWKESPNRLLTTLVRYLKFRGFQCNRLPFL